MSVTASVICSEPIGVVAARDAIYVACTQDAAIVKLDAHTLTPLARTQLASTPWGLAWSADGSIVASLFFGPGATVLDPATLAITAQWTVPVVASRSDARLAHGQPRGFYDLAARPGTHDMWLVHELLGTDKAQPTLDFERTAFPRSRSCPVVRSPRRCRPTRKMCQGSMARSATWSRARTRSSSPTMARSRWSSIPTAKISSQSRVRASKPRSRGPCPVTCPRASRSRRMTASRTSTNATRAMSPS